MTDEEKTTLIIVKPLHSLLHSESQKYRFQNSRYNHNPIVQLKMLFDIDVI